MKKLINSLLVPLIIFVMFTGLSFAGGYPTYGLNNSQLARVNKVSTFNTQRATTFRSLSDFYKGKIKALPSSKNTSNLSNTSLTTTGPSKTTSTPSLTTTAPSKTTSTPSLTTTAPSKNTSTPSLTTTAPSKTSNKDNIANSTPTSSTSSSTPTKTTSGKSSTTNTADNTSSTSSKISKFLKNFKNGGGWKKY